jgi:hypothetical protein
MARGSDGLCGGQKSPTHSREAHGGELERAFGEGAKQLERRITGREAAWMGTA